MEPLPTVSPHQPMMIQFTSGTTGKPKGAVLTHHGVLNTSQLTVRRLDLPSHAIWLLATPLFHTGGSVYCLLGTLCNRGALVVMPTFDPGLLIRLVEEESVNYFQSVPTLHLRVLEHPEFSSARVSSLLGIGSGGTTVPEELVHRFESAYGAEYFMIFGQTELSSRPRIPGGRYDRPQGTHDRLALPHIEMKSRSGDGATVARGMPSVNLCTWFFRHEGVFQHAEQTANTIDADGWLHAAATWAVRMKMVAPHHRPTKDMIIRGGKISSREIDALAAHPAVGEVAVIGIPDREWGEQIAAIVRLRPGLGASAAELEQFLRARIARHKVPRRWHFVEQFPVTPSGKIKKFELRETYGTTAAP
jgi:fatty-acyl-CoA synthase